MNIRKQEKEMRTRAYMSILLYICYDCGEDAWERGYHLDGVNLCTKCGEKRNEDKANSQDTQR